MKTMVLALLVGALLVVFCSVGEAINDDSLILYYSFDEGQGNTTKDLSGKGNIGILKDGPTWTDGKVGKALSFDGKAGHVDCGNDSILDLTDAVTLEAWVMPNELPTRRYAGVVCKHGCYKIRQDLETGAQGKFYGFVYTSADWKPFCVSTTDPQVGEWYHVAFTYDEADGELKTYVNGVLEGTVEKNAPIDVKSENHLAVGADIGEADRVYNGTVDEVAVYSRALSEEEINQDMTRGVILAVSLEGKLTATWASIKAQ